MNERARRRAMRNIVASMLMSNLTRADIIEIAEDLAYGRLGHELGDMLRHVSIILPDGPSERYDLEQVRQPEPQLAEIAYDVVQKRRMTKKTLIQAMATISSKFAKNDFPAGTSREVLEWFFERATPNQASRLLGMLTEEDQDLYLKGIVRRS